MTETKNANEVAERVPKKSYFDHGSTVFKRLLMTYKPSYGSGMCTRS